MVYEEKMRIAMIPLAGMLYLGHIWPTPHKPGLLASFLHSFYRWYCMIFYSIVPVMEGGYVVQHIDDLSESTEAATTLFTAGVTDFSYHMPFIQHVHADEKGQFSEIKTFLEDTMDSDLKISRFMFMALTPSCGGTVVCYSLIPPITMLYNYMYNPESYKLLLPFRFANPFDWENNTPSYVLMYFVNLSAGWLTTLGFVGMDTIFGSIMVTMIRQCAILARLIRDHHKHAVLLAGDGASLERVEEVCYDLLKQWIQHYERILKEQENIEVLGPVFFSQFGGASLTICLLAFKTDMESSHPGLLATYFFYFTAASVQLMIYCWYGERLVDVAQNLGEEAYQSPWEDRSIRYQQALRMVIRQTQRHPRLSAMGFWELSLPTFRAIYSTAVSYYTLLQSVGGD